MLATFTSFVHRVTTQSIVPVFASEMLHMTPKDIGMLFTISGLSVFVMILPAGFVIDKVGRKWATVPSTGIPAIAFLLIPFADSFLQLAILLVVSRHLQRTVAWLLGDVDFRRRAGPRARPAPSGAPHPR